MNLERGTVRQATSAPGAPLFEKVLFVECPGCGAEGPAQEMLSEWDAEKFYRFKCCGERSDLIRAKNWLEEVRR